MVSVGVPESDIYVSLEITNLCFNVQTIVSMKIAFSVSRDRHFQFQFQFHFHFEI